MGYFRFILDTKSLKRTNKRYHFDPQHSLPTENKEMQNPVKDCMIDDWDLLEKLLDFIYKNHIRDKSDAHPVLMSEAPVSIRWNFYILCIEKRF